MQIANGNYIVIEGNIGAGKTSFCQKIAAELDAKLILEQFSDNPFLPLFYKNPERYSFPVELFFMSERHKQLQEFLLEHLYY
jgi:deoxyadenosine/deoxycytidine kinase